MKRTNTLRRRKRTVATGILVAVMAALIVMFARRAQGAAEHIFPLVRDKWYRTLHIIRDKTPAQTIVNSWWDFGDWFKVIGRRRVIFDGQSQHTPQAYWMAKAIRMIPSAKMKAAIKIVSDIKVANG